jgi:mRNA interferase MazF
VNRGEVWWVERPNVGRRPHLVLTRQRAIPVLSSVVAVPATRTRRGIATEVPVGPDDGLPTECVLSLDNVTLVPKALFRERICRLEAERMREVCAALAVATGCS